MGALGAIIIVSMVILSFGVLVKSLPLMIGSRLLFGVAGDSLTALSIAMFADYFPEEEIGFALGVFFLLSHLGVLMTLVVSPFIESNYGILMAYFATILVSAFGLLFLISIQIVDKISTKEKRLSHFGQERDSEIDCRHGLRSFFESFTCKFKKAFWSCAFFSVFMFNGLWILTNSGKIYIVEKFYPDAKSDEKDSAADSDIFVFQGVVIIGNIFFGFISFKCKTYPWAFLPTPFLFIVSVLLMMDGVSSKFCFFLAGVAISIFHSNLWSNLMVTIADKDRVCLTILLIPLLLSMLPAVCLWDHCLHAKHDFVGFPLCHFVALCDHQEVHHCKLLSSFLSQWRC